MAKAPSRAPEPTDDDEDQGEPVPPDADGLVELLNARIGDLKRGAYSDDPTAELGKLSRALVPLIAEQRAKAKAAKRALVAITPETIKAWLREQTPEVRAKVRREIEALDAPHRRSVLAQ